MTETIMVGSPVEKPMAFTPEAKYSPADESCRRCRGTGRVEVFVGYADFARAKMVYGEEVARKTTCAVACDCELGDRFARVSGNKDRNYPRFSSKFETVEIEYPTNPVSSASAVEALRVIGAAVASKLGREQLLGFMAKREVDNPGNGWHECMKELKLYYEQIDSIRAKSAQEDEDGIEW